VPAGARFCTECGVRVRAARANLPWYLAGAALVGLILVVLVPLSGSAPAPATSAAQSAPMLDGGAGAGAPATSDETPPPLTGTPREQADRLFNLIMQNKEKGDTARARFFVPMGVQAYQMAGTLDDDGLFHLSLLQTLGGSAADGLATAQRILASSDRNLLGLVAAAEAAAARGDATAARGYYQRFAAAFDAEKSRALPEYRDHAAALPAYLDEARQYLAKQPR
jgi:hypothetical protein